MVAFAEGLAFHASPRSGCAALRLVATVGEGRILALQLGLTALWTFLGNSLARLRQYFENVAAILTLIFENGHSLTLYMYLFHYIIRV